MVTQRMNVQLGRLLLVSDILAVSSIQLDTSLRFQQPCTTQGIRNSGGFHEVVLQPLL